MKEKKEIEKKKKERKKIWLSISDSVGRYIMKYLSPIEFALITLASRYCFNCTSGINVALHVGGVLHTPWVTPAVTLQQMHCTPGDKHTPTHACTWTHTHIHGPVPHNLFPTHRQARFAKQVGSPQLTNPSLNYTCSTLERMSFH